MIIFAKNLLIMENQNNLKRLYRSRINKILAGICGGIGEYLNIDPTIVRVLWILFSLMGGSGVIAYLLCLFVIPQDNTNQIN